MKQIRQICIYWPLIKDKYWVADDGTIFGSNNIKCTRLLVNGHRKEISKTKKYLLKYMEEHNMTFIHIPDTEGQYILLHNGLILKRLKTGLHHVGKPRSVIGLFTNKDQRTVQQVARFVAACFIGPVDGLDVHHVDFNPLNNAVENLKIVTREEHRELHKSEFTGQSKARTPKRGEMGEALLGL